ncbi:MAG: hypothetical protein R3B49_04685 [Phycisphaerales bacterium]
MRRLWTIISVVCFLNAMGVLVVLGWLLNTGRVDRQRLQDVRELFRETTAQRDAREKAEQKEAEQAAALTRVANVENGEPMSADARLDSNRAQSQADIERMQRIRREVKDLQDAVVRQRQLLDKEREGFESNEAAFNKMRRDIAELEGSEQFKKALVVFEQLKPADAKAAMAALLDQGKQDEVVGYLDAMEDRARTKVVAEFIKDADAPLAAKLLEELRVRGIGDLALGDPVP